jgi:hypothetical protein
MVHPRISSELTDEKRSDRSKETENVAVEKYVEDQKTYAFTTYPDRFQTPFHRSKKTQK